ncbi:MAG: ATP-binding cassette domain-containing protein [Deltaproteobacteria bacterium]|jgi:ATP-binding cassette subfamily F protein 3|nr:ATP-binding cassette domain-containing protein [Deltaproteobacteria bacterium]
MPLVSFSEVTRFHGRQDVLNGVTFSIEPSERVGLVGRNGAGKTTIIRLICEEENLDSGKVTKVKELKLGYLPQDVSAQGDQKLLRLVMDTDPRFTSLETKLKEIETLLSSANLERQSLNELVERQGSLMQEFEAMGGWERENEAKKVLSGLGFEEKDFQRSLSEFSGGWIMRGVLARLLVSKPDLLILDEPTNHLDLDSLIWLEDYLKSSTSALLLVSHDRVFLNNLAQKIIELRRGRVVSYSGDYDFFLAEKTRRLITESAAFNNQKERIKQLERFIERNRVRASTAKRAQSRIKVLEKLDLLPQPDDELEGSFNLKLPSARRGPDVVAKLINVTKKYGQVEVYRDLNLTLLRGTRLALIGPNGRGKSTLVKLLAGLTSPTSGTVRLGQNVDLGYFSQFQMESLNPQLTVLEQLSQAGGNLGQGPLRNILGGFLFYGDDVFKKVSVLSGGEKTRLVLAKIMLGAPNLLIMDEPTNHLDIPGRQMLEEALEDYQSTMILISHDRHFINKLCDSVGIIENGRLTIYPGNFDDYQSLWLKGGSQKESQQNPTPLIEFNNSKEVNFLKKNQKFKNKKSPKLEKKTAPSSARQAAWLQKSLLSSLNQTEERLKALQEQSAMITNSLSEPITYKDGEKAKNLSQELSAIESEIKEQEKIWEETLASLEQLDS